MKDKIPTQRENEKGLHQRYYIQKIVKDEKNFFESDAYRLEQPDEGAEYFVMRLDEGGSDIGHIKACRIGIHAYSDAIKHHLPDLANDLKERYPLL